MKALRQVGAAALPLIIGGCAATGATYPEFTAGTAPVADTTRVVMYRTGESMQGAARSARVAIDQKTAGNVDYKGFNSFDVAPGRHLFTVDLWDVPGSCTLAWDVAPDHATYFEIAPRTSSLVAGMLGGVLGSAIESSGKECGGAFAMIPVDEEAAVPVLAPLRKTK